MNVQAIIDRARRLTYLSSTQYNDPKAIEDFNIVYEDLVNRIVYEVNEDFFWDTFTTDLVIGQSEYTLPTDVIKLRELYVNYGEGEVKATEINGNTLTGTEVFSESSPKWYVKDESVFLLPESETAETAGLKLMGIKSAADLVITDLEEDIILPKEFHYLIAEGMKNYIYQSRGIIDAKNDAIASYEMSVNEMVQKLTDRSANPTVGLLPGLEYYS